jgi:multidrug efflux pump subunit AcrA (membrane-fusion protein)
VDAEQVERAKREIQGLVHEIAELSKSQISPAEFYDAMLNKVVAALAAPGGAVWTVSDSGGLQLAYQINLRMTGLYENSVAQQQHGRLLHQVLQGSEGALIAPHSGAGDATDIDEEAAANPTDYLLVLAPVHNDQGAQGVVEIFQRTGARVTTQRGYLRFLLQVCEFAGDFLKARRLQHLSEKQTLWEQLESFTRTAHEKLDVQQTAYTIVNEGRRLIGCDRVSVAIRRGGRCPIEAVSGQDTFDKRSNVTVLLSKLAAAVAKTGEDVWYSGDTSDLAPQVEEALDAYVDESHTKSIAILPLTEPRDEEAKFVSEQEREPPVIIGALIVEQMVDSRTPDGFLQRVGVVRTHSSTALTNALEYEGLFLMPLWRALGHGTRYFRGRALPKTLAILGSIIAALAFLCFYQAQFKLEGDGRLKPTLRQSVWAEISGYVTDVNVKHDDPVTKGQLLVVQRSLELERQLAQTQGDLESTRQDLYSKERLRSSNVELTEMELATALSDINQLTQKVKALENTLAILQEQQKMLEVRSPIDGRVVTWNITDLLLGRPVNLGEELIEIADPNSDWELEILMPEYRMGHIAKAAHASPDKLPVTFYLAANPKQQLQGHVEEIHRSAEVRGEDGNTVLVRVSFDQQALRDVIADPRIGMTATGKVHCGKRAIGYVWFHDLVDFVRAKILFRLF